MDHTAIERFEKSLVIHQNSDVSLTWGLNTQRRKNVVRFNVPLALRTVRLN